MVMNKEIQEFLMRENPDFSAGFSLLCKYCPNESLISYIGRTGNAEMLLYELKKLDKGGFVRPNARGKDLESRYNTARRKECTDTENPGPETHFKTFDERRTRRADLPEDLQTVYDAISEDYKLRRALHDKMKCATADADRAEFRERILETQERIAAGWKKIDEYLANKASSEAEKDFNETSCRAYISRALNKEKISETVSAGVKARIAALRKNGCTVTDEMVDALRERGIDV